MLEALVLILREKINEMFVPIGERPSCDPVDVQFMSEARKRPLDDSFKSQIVRISPLPGFGEETSLAGTKWTLRDMRKLRANQE